MSTKKTTTGNNADNWAEIIQARADSGLSIRKYCESVGIHENSYYYWQHKLQKAASQAVSTDKILSDRKTIQSKEAIPKGWILCSARDTTLERNELYIEIGQYRIKATMETNAELLTKICRVLVAI